MQKRDNLIPQTFLPLHESGSESEGQQVHFLRGAVEQSVLHSSSFPPSPFRRRSPLVRPSVRLLSRSPGSVNFPRRLLDLDEKNDGTVSNGGERRVRGRRRGGEGLTIVLSD